MKMGSVVTCIAALVALVAALPAQEEGLSGVLGKQTIWQGQVRLAGDVTVPKGGRLEIAAGTVVTIAGRDGTRSGWNPDKVELHVEGQLVVDGKLEAPVVFMPDDGKQERSDAARSKSWHGIVLHPREGDAEHRHVVRGAQLWRAFAGIELAAGDALVEDCVFHSCSEGIEVGCAYRDERYTGLPGGLADPEIRRSRFVDCGTAIYCQGQARAHVERCVFARCATGVGPNRPGISSQQGRPGSRIIGCAFVEVFDAVVGRSVVRECWFQKCTRALRLSNYHDRLATDIEHVVFENNLADGVEELVAGDTGAARGALRGKVQTVGSLDSLRAPWPPLPDALKLSADSAGKACGLGGRDLGPMSGGGPVVAEVAAPWNGPLLRGWLAAPVDAGKSWRKLTGVAAGARCNKSWWASADCDEDGLLHLKQAFGPGRTGGVLALPFTAASAGEVVLPWTGDVAELEIALDGKVVLSQKSRRRFGGDEAPATIAYEAGEHLLLVHVEGWSGDPRFALGAVDAWQPTPQPAEREVEMKASVKRVRNAPVIEVKPSVAVHWAATAGRGPAELRDPTGRTFATTWEWTDAGLLRITPAASAPRKEELRLVWTGLRDVAGKLLEVEPTTVKLP
ncbi:MAG: hypothetical protein R3F29_06200 [Planctomycetota bacterium]